MKTLKTWLPALLMMAIIFGFSSIPSDEMPHFGGFDFSVKKLGHALGYALLAIAYLRALRSTADGTTPWKTFIARHAFALAWVLAVLYAGTDEFHQSFVPGRNSSIWDVLVFDNLGALTGLLAFRAFNKKDL